MKRDTPRTLRELVAKAIWDSEQLEMERREKKPAGYYAPWPADADKQPYCRSTYRQADFIIAALAAATPASTARIVCLCGSTRFYEHFQRANYEETMAGRIVLSVGFYPHAQKEMHHSEDVGCTAEQKIALDELHKRKIDLADEVLVLNVGGYIGSSTRSEIDYAVAHNKPVRYLEVAQRDRQEEKK